jgi:hypothetical protein
MGSPALIPRVQKDDWVNLNRVLRKLAYAALGPGAAPVFASLTLTGLTANRLISSDTLKALTSVGALTAWIAGTEFQVIVTDDSDGTVTLSLPQNIHAGASPTFVGLTLTGNLLVGGTTKTQSGRIPKDHLLTSNTTLDETYDEVFCDTDGGAFTITLPETPVGQRYRIINCGSNILTLDPNGNNIVGGPGNLTLDAGDVLIIKWNATKDWW